MSAMTCRERILAAMRRMPVDHVPCVPVCNPLHERQRVGYRYQFPWGPSQRERCEYLVNEMGVDAYCVLDIPATNPAPGVSSRVWLEGDLIHKVWNTPRGELSASVRYDDQWIHGLDVPFYSDFLVGHCVKHWVETEQDLECLKTILRSPEHQAALEKLRFEFMQVKRLADRLQLPIIAGIGKGLTGGLQLVGPAEICLMTLEQPDLIRAYLQWEHDLNTSLLNLAADLGVDIVRRNGFYETADFYGPAMLQDFLAGFLRQEVRLAREAGMVSTYTLNTGLMPILDHMATLEFDCFDSIDIAFKDVDLRRLCASQPEGRSYWIGPSSAYHLWQDDPEPARAAVRLCFEVIGKRGLLISPSPSIHSIMPWSNMLAIIAQWRELR
ncbi:MAG: uroporphyrinogen decarboxylase family protein [Planctomycetota bacterium]|jgi:hypothetical protein|nr:uroporphyrinogen decarboxylase family protein [Planctomycetota bacterium]